MKKRSIKFLNSTALRTLAVSCIGCFFGLFCFLNIMDIWRTAELLKKERLNMTKNKLYTVIEDLDAQMESMRTITLEIANKREFSRKFWGEGKYNEMQMLGYLGKYQQVFSIYEGYFLRYKDAVPFFLSTGKTRTPHIYYKAEIGEDQYEEFMNSLDRLMAEGTKSFDIYREGDIVLLIYSLNIYSVSKNGYDGIVCYKISRSSIEERIECLVQKLDGELVIYLDDVCILGEEKILEDPENMEDIIEITSSKGNFRIFYREDGNSSVISRNIFSRESILNTLSISMWLILLGFVVAYLNYRPMIRIVKKYGTALDEAEAMDADWKSVDKMLGMLTNKNKIKGEQILEQWEMLKEQTIRLIISGLYSEKIQTYMSLMNIKHDANVYFVLKCSIEDSSINVMEGQEHTICNDLEALSDEEMFFYLCWDSKKIFYVLLALEEKYHLDAAMELLYSLFEAKGLQVSIELAKVIEDLRNTKSQHKEESIHGSLEKDTTANKNKSDVVIVKKALQYIEEHYMDYDLSLEMVAGEVQITSTYLSSLIRQTNGKSYKEYLIELRIEAAKRMLKNKSINIESVCQQVGYTNVSHFIKTFQKYVGMTPAKYRDYVNREDTE